MSLRRIDIYHKLKKRKGYTIEADILNLMRECIVLNNNWLLIIISFKCANKMYTLHASKYAVFQNASSLLLNKWHTCHFLFLLHFQRKVVERLNCALKWLFSLFLWEELRLKKKKLGEGKFRN